MKMALLLLVAVFVSAVVGQLTNSVPMSKLAMCEERDCIPCGYCGSLGSLKNYNVFDHTLYIKMYVFSEGAAYINIHGDAGSVEIEIRNGFSQMKLNGLPLDENWRVGVISPLFATPIVIRQTWDGWMDVAITGIEEPLLAGLVGQLKTKDQMAPDWKPIAGCVNRDHRAIGGICLYNGRYFFNCPEEEDKYCRSHINNNIRRTTNNTSFEIPSQ